METSCFEVPVQVQGGAGAELSREEWGQFSFPDKRQVAVRKELPGDCFRHLILPNGIKLPQAQQFSSQIVSRL